MSLLRVATVPQSPLQTKRLQLADLKVGRERRAWPQSAGAHGNWGWRALRPTSGAEGAFWRCPRTWRTWRGWKESGVCLCSLLVAVCCRCSVGVHPGNGPAYVRACPNVLGTGLLAPLTRTSKDLISGSEMTSARLPVAGPLGVIVEETGMHHRKFRDHVQHRPLQPTRSGPRPPSPGTGGLPLQKGRRQV